MHIMYQSRLLSPSRSHGIMTYPNSAPQIKVSVYLPGLVNAELYRAEESRPTRFRKKYDIEYLKVSIRN